jgi:hypothetical protein
MALPPPPGGTSEAPTEQALHSVSEDPRGSVVTAQASIAGGPPHARVPLTGAISPADRARSSTNKAEGSGDQEPDSEHCEASADVIVVGNDAAASLDEPLSRLFSRPQERHESRGEKDAEGSQQKHPIDV